MSVALLLCVILGLAGFLAWADRNDALALTTSTKQETFAELYFTQPNDLPSTVKAGESHTFSFAITNRSNAKQTYTYLVQMQDDTGVIGVKSKTVTISPSQTSRQQATIHIPATGDRFLTIVSLVPNQQSIKFYTSL